VLTERVIDLLEHLPRRGEGGREVATHADGLASLAGKYEGERHDCCVSVPLTGGRA